MHPVCSHDLPNQIVALQSLLQFFALDEAEHLTPQGREYFQRLQSITGKTQLFVQYLKELARLQRQEARPEALTIAQFADDVRADVRRRFPDQDWKWQGAGPTEKIWTDRRLLQQGVIHLLHAAIGSAPGTGEIALAAICQPDVVQLTVVVKAAAATASPLGDAEAIERRLAFALAQEYLAAAETVCRPVEGPAAGATTFALEIPSRSPHG